jgi:alkylation response protein AidB-like acyl-CoA dehydrogenase
MRLQDEESDVDLRNSVAEQAYRDEVRSALCSLLPTDWSGYGSLDPEQCAQFDPWWRQQLLEHGMLAAGWPAEYGGGGLTITEQSIVAEELAEVGAPQYPTPNDTFGLQLLGPTLMHYGTQEQRDYFLPRTLSGEIRWAQGYSEPEAGSDLFNVRTVAHRSGDTWVVNGQKVWQTAGTTANWIFTVVRTDPEVKGAKGLSFILIPIDQPGVIVRGIRNIAGETELAEVFFDDAVASAEHVVGEVGQGGTVALALLGFERGAGGLASAVSSRIELERLAELIADRGKSDDTSLTRRLAQCRADVHAIRCLALRTLAAVSSRAVPGPEASVTKWFVSRYRHRVTELAMDVLGSDGVALTGADTVAPLGPQPKGLDPASRAAWIQDALHARPVTIYGGSLQIQRNTIGERLLGLPREQRPTTAAR